MKVIVRKIRGEYRLFVKSDAMAESPAGARLHKANHPQHPFPKRMVFDDAGEAMSAAEALTDYLERDAKLKPNRKKRR